MTVANDLPPQRTSRTYKTRNVMEYLSSFGWQPPILSVMGRVGDLKSQTPLRTYPLELQIERTPDLNIAGWGRKAETRVRAAGGNPGVCTRRPRSPDSPGGSSSGIGGALRLPIHLGLHDSTYSENPLS